ncbi:hypothetical protein [Tautonia sociabilis]|uniref:Uncharacterized protein n=1 Tax=Tautonia sociabilis TaxID=2080755 RepID=A0A432MKR7_9BACT|nr:hypothetical protein [Tautonia sociabilis]RUL88001.1 hypothetical protein TsocGM_09780 [Tautonia sociabilis]
MAKDRSEHDWQERRPRESSVTGGSSTGRHVVPGYDPAAHGFATVQEHEASCRYSPWVEKDQVTWSDAERSVYSCLVSAIEKIGATEKLKVLLGTDLGLRLSYQGPFSIDAPIEPEPQSVLGAMVEELLVQDKDTLHHHVQISDNPLSSYVLRLSVAALPRWQRELTRERKAVDDHLVERIEKERQQKEQQLVELTLPRAIPLEHDSVSEVEEGIERLSKYVAEIHKPVVIALQGLLDRLHEIKNLGSYEANAHAASEIYRLAKACDMDLIYEGTPVAIGCVKRSDYKQGAFRLRTLSGKAETILTSKNFPSLQLSPLDATRQG